MRSTIGEGKKLSCVPLARPYRHFSLAEIQYATKNFNPELVIGRGGFGKVYKGRVFIGETSHVVAIKRLDSMSNQGASEFRAEIEMLSRLRHCHLVSLIGYCDDRKEMILVYEYMRCGTLYHHLHKAKTTLNWVKRLKIAIGAGRGLDYLHTGVGTKHGVIHRDVKTSNILLDENWTAMISDFGLSIIGSTNHSSSYVDASVKGTFGYLDPEHAVDVRNGEDQCSLVRWAQKCVKDRKFDQMVDPNIRGTIFPKCLRQFAHIADRCVYSVPKERPTMTEVVASLEDLLESQKKYKNSAEPSSTTGITSKMNRYFRLSTKVNYEFTYDELKHAARGFGYETCLGEWRYGKIYKGWVDETTYSPSMLDSGLAISIKIFQRAHQKSLDNSELELVLTYLSHPNIVKLIGYCLEGDVLFLVYEFMHKGNFEDCLHRGAIARLPLDTRVKMALGIARGLFFLHNTQDNSASDWSWTQKMCVFERCNILLTEDFTAKFWNYNVWKFRTWNDEKIDCYYHSGCRRPKSLYGRSNLASFTLVLAEILIGEPILGSNAYKNLSLQDFGKHLEILKNWKSLCSLAKFCLEICNDVDSELKLLRALKKLYPSMMC
ncbi:serine/threonine/dual specificity protein kinase, catalytic domain-containing protein [Artemisia annua]|uniref:Serine/threonine/dual specificity protein kinase, catalytic domain-containing protein n=1 Tax=Artemisia annua TaxID=35608 RepID=A0A2U1KR20_ARTAN|nr:serine/threonine/dual specificity protein kinase, catalytic domain-containing protein [Artemisia annua]